MRGVLQLCNRFGVGKRMNFGGEIIKMQRFNFSENVWGERTMKWIEDRLGDHVKDNKEDYHFDVPFLLNNKDINKTRTAIITPCVKLPTSTYLIKEMSKRGYHVTTIAHPTSNMKVLLIPPFFFPFFSLLFLFCKYDFCACFVISVIRNSKQ